MSSVASISRSAILIVVALSVSACGPGAAPSTTPTPSVEIRNVTDQAEVEMEADNFYFEPKFLRGRPGQRLTLMIRNESDTLHNFSIPEQQIDQDIPPRRTVEVDVTFPQSGTTDFFCKYHVEQGMTGQLLVGEAMPPVSLVTTPTPEPGLGY